MAQDLPPSGGYEAVQYKRNLPARGFRPSYYLFAIGVICTYGLYKTGQGIREHKYVAVSFPPVPPGLRGRLQQTETGFRASHLAPMRKRQDGDGKSALTGRQWADLLAGDSELAREKMWSRIYLIPMLQAEEDRDLVRRTWADKARERELMGGESKAYHSDRFVRPTYSITPKNITK